MLRPLFGTKQISQPVLTHCKTWSLGTNGSETWIKIQYFSVKNIYLNKCQKNVGHFVQTLSYWTQPQYYGWYRLRWSVLSEHHTLHQADLSLRNARIKVPFSNPLSYSSQAYCLQLIKYLFWRWIESAKLWNCTEIVIVNCILFLKIQWQKDSTDPLRLKVTGIYQILNLQLRVASIEISSPIPRQATIYSKAVKALHITHRMAVSISFI